MQRRGRRRVLYIFKKKYFPLSLGQTGRNRDSTLVRAPSLSLIDNQTHSHFILWLLVGSSQTNTKNMSVKLFRRGSARCIGLFVAFFTIMLCLYYMSIGQQTQQSLAGPEAADGSASSSSSAGSAASALLSKGVYAAQR